MARKQRRHEIVITVAFDRPVSRVQAVQMARQCIKGQEDRVSWPWSERWAAKMRIGSVKFSMRRGRAS